MSIVINNIQKKSLATDLPLVVGDKITKIDDEPVEDIIDLMFLTQKESFTIEYINSHNNKQKCIVENNFDKPLGYEVLLPSCVNCVNQCIFCFVDQMPKGLRDSLYIKDDDFIYSFFYGNFITLTNLSVKAINKITSQHISPLYVSVHTTNPVLHKKMLRYPIDFNITDTLKIFNDANIELHTQIVVVPEYNDKEELFKTLTDLVEMENITSIGIVPIGLTKYRKKLTKLRKFTKAEAVELISHVEFMKNMRKLEHIYLADEFFVLAGLPIPEDYYYNNYEQIENGIGMIRKSWENWKYIKRKFLTLLNKTEGNPVFVTSVSGIQAINPILKDIQKSLKNKQIKAFVIKNEFFGDEVTVTGLLTWQDIKSQLKLNDDEYPVFSSAIFNHEMLTIDNIHIDNLKDELNKKFIITDELFSEWDIY